MPRGYGKNSGRINSKIRSAVVSALGILDHEGTPLKVLLAAAFRKDPVRTLQAVSRFLPTEARVEIVDVARLHLAAIEEMSGARRLLDLKPDIQPKEADGMSQREQIEQLLS